MIQHPFRNEERIALKELFLSHYSGDAHELYQLATALRLRGIVPWVDKQGGFLIADASEAEARRVIREDCFGLLLYATEHVFDRSFIRDIEMDEARKVHAADPAFALFAVPRGISFGDLRQRSNCSFQIDLSGFHTVPIPDDDALLIGQIRVAREVLRKVLRRSSSQGGSGQFSLQFSTRELLPDRSDDVLRIDATALFSVSTTNPEGWNRLIDALGDVKREIAAAYGRPRLYLHGSKHLTAAFIFGRVFSQYEIDIRQTPAQVWRTDAHAPNVELLDVSEVRGDPDDGRLFLEVASRYKNVAAGVNSFIATNGLHPSLRLQLRPKGEALTLDNELCSAMVRETYVELEHVLRANQGIREIHLFAAVPQSYMIMLGRQFQGIPPVYLYEWTGREYVHTCSIPEGVL
jgi:hypothetical protein